MRTLLLVALIGAGSVAQTPDAPDPRNADHIWRYSQSASVRLYIRSDPGLPTPSRVTCSVIGPSKGARSEAASTIEREFRGREFATYYPHDFGRRVFPGSYRWSCQVENGVHASGEFEIRADGVVDLPARE